jgi:hypothetical protein
MKFYEKHQDKRDRFEIVAFHGPGGDSFDDLEPRLAGIRERHWGGRHLPFPSLLDNTGATLKALGVKVYPTYILIDPEGRIVRNGSKEMLERKLTEG